MDAFPSQVFDGSHISVHAPATPTLSVITADTFTRPPTFCGLGFAAGKVIKGGEVSRIVTWMGALRALYVSSQPFALALAVNVCVPTMFDVSCHVAIRVVPAAIAPRE